MLCRLHLRLRAAADGDERQQLEGSGGPGNKRQRQRVVRQVELDFDVVYWTPAPGVRCSTSYVTTSSSSQAAAAPAPTDISFQLALLACLLSVCFSVFCFQSSVLFRAGQAMLACRSSARHIHWTWDGMTCSGECCIWCLYILSKITENAANCEFVTAPKPLCLLCVELFSSAS